MRLIASESKIYAHKYFCVRYNTVWITFHHYFLIWNVQRRQEWIRHCCSTHVTIDALLLLFHFFFCNQKQIICDFQWKQLVETPFRHCRIDRRLYLSTHTKLRRVHFATHDEHLWFAIEVLDLLRKFQGGKSSICIICGQIYPTSFCVCVCSFQTDIVVYFYNLNAIYK